MRRGREKGFTLVELMIVVVIIGILAAIAIPKFGNMIGKAKASEATQTLGQVIRLENTYFQGNNAYVDFNIALADPPVPYDASLDCPSIGFAQPSNARFTYGFQTDIASAKERTDIPEGDVNADGDNADGLTLSVANVKDILVGSNLAW